MKYSPVLLIAALLLCGSCRSVGKGDPIAPLTATSPEDALAQLLMRAETFAGARSLIRVKAAVGGDTQNFRAQLAVPNRNEMDFAAYTPVGTTAVTIHANGDRISYTNHLQGTTVKGTAEELARALAFYGDDLEPAEMGMLILGLPPRRELNYETTARGIARVVVGDAVVTFDPPEFPPTRVRIVRGADVIDIEHLETVAGP